LPAIIVGGACGGLACSWTKARAARQVRMRLSYPWLCKTGNFTPLWRQVQHRKRIEQAWKKFKMLRLTYCVMITTAVSMYSSQILAEPQPAVIPDYSVEKSCEIFMGRPRPLAACLFQESHYRGEVADIWTRIPDPDRGKCAELANQSERGKYQVLSRCLRAAISEAAWKDAVGSIKKN
jgi:hypothetical protein